jgi:hypothetical protein
MFAALLLLTSTMKAGAGAYIVTEITLDSSKKIQSVLSVGDHAIRMEMQGEKAAGTAIYRADLQAFWMVNDKDKTYTEMTKAQMDQMAEALKNLPPAVRKMMGGAAPDLPKYVKKASGEKVGRWTATRYEASIKNGVHKMWTIPASQVHVTAADMAVLKEFGKFFEKFAQDKAAQYQFDGANLGFSGFPVKNEMVENGKVKNSSVVTEAASKTFPASTFEAPAGYKKKEMKGMK